VGGDRRSKSAAQKVKLLNDGPSTTAVRLAPILGVGSALIVSDGAFAAAIDSIAENVSADAAQEIRAGQSGISKIWYHNSCVRAWDRFRSGTTRKYIQVPRDRLLEWH
jgi:hypothetical protein